MNAQVPVSTNFISQTDGYSPIKIGRKVVFFNCSQGI